VKREEKKNTNDKSRPREAYFQASNDDFFEKRHVLAPRCRGKNAKQPKVDQLEERTLWGHIAFDQGSIVFSLDARWTDSWGQGKGDQKGIRKSLMPRFIPEAILRIRVRLAEIWRRR